MEYDTIRYDSVYITCSKKLTGRNELPTQLKTITPANTFKYQL